MLDEQIVEGRYLKTDDRLAAYVGIGLVESLDLELGSRFVLRAQDANKEIAGQLVRVVGIFRTGIQVIDQALVHIPITTANEWLDTEHGVTNIGVLVEPSTAAPLVSRHLRNALTEAIDSRSATVMSWQESMPELAAIVAIDEFGNYLIFGILFLIIGLGIVNTVLMSVLHRRREFGMLQALGLTPKQTGTLILVEGLTLTSISGIFGVALGVILTWFFFGEGLDLSMMVTEDMTFSGVAIDPVVIPLFRTTRILQSFMFILCIGVVSSIYPALRAARIDVPEAMKFDR
jgi:ABC-type lipoprotein release transport system permease subunit